MARLHLPLSLLLITGCVSAPLEDPLWVSAVVKFSARENRGKLVLTCAPRTGATGVAWIDECERIGRRALDQATTRGSIQPVVGAAFGQAADFFRRMPPGAAAGQVLEREVPVVRTAL
jgi:hypothetical protein